MTICTRVQELRPNKFALVYGTEPNTGWVYLARCDYCNEKVFVSVEPLAYINIDAGKWSDLHSYILNTHSRLRHVAQLWLARPKEDYGLFIFCSQEHASAYEKEHSWK